MAAFEVRSSLNNLLEKGSVCLHDTLTTPFPVRPRVQRGRQIWKEQAFDFVRSQSGLHNG